MVESNKVTVYVKAKVVMPSIANVVLYALKDTTYVTSLEVDVGTTVTFYAYVYFTGALPKDATLIMKVYLDDGLYTSKTFTARSGATQAVPTFQITFDKEGTHTVKVDVNFA